MEFRILGPVEVRDDGRLVRLGGGKQRAVLALLLLNANRVVASERMIELLWGERPPATAATALHGHISSLRKALGPDVIATRPPGYVLETAIGELDLERFEWLQAEGRDALGRGDPGRAAERLRERFWAQLMLALYRSGRQAEALDAYRRARQTLVSQLGIEPGPELREFERRILAHDPTLGPGPRVPTPLRRTANVRPALVLMALAAIGVIVTTLLLLGGDPGRTAVPADSVANIDLRRNAVVGAIPVLQDPGPIAAGARRVWAVNRDSQSVSRIDPQARRLLGTKGVGEVPGNVAGATGEVWILDRCLGGEPGRLLHVHTAAGGGIDLDEAISLANLTP